MSTRSIILWFNPEKQIFEAHQKYQDGYANTAILRRWHNTPEAAAALMQRIMQPAELREFGTTLDACIFRDGVNYNAQSTPIFDTSKSKLYNFRRFLAWLRNFDSPEFASIWVPALGWCDFPIDSHPCGATGIRRQWSPHERSRWKEYALFRQRRTESTILLSEFMWSLATGSALPAWRDSMAGEHHACAENASFVRNLPADIRFLGEKSADFQRLRSEFAQLLPALPTPFQIENNENTFFYLRHWNGKRGHFVLQLNPCRWGRDNEPPTNWRVTLHQLRRGKLEHTTIRLYCERSKKHYTPFSLTAEELAPFIA